MMARIHVLTLEVRNLIAAGEVVERPASVVKELVENSIDAGAAEIRIEVSGGGLENISVTDDGCGMEGGDIKLCIARHSTSKLRTADDLTEIKTMGFRGEALPSIAAVSRVKIESRSRETELQNGHVLFVEGGEVCAFEEKGFPFGTRIEVSDLFYNVPARKKFARSAKTELGHIKDIVLRLALANPEIRFQLVSEGRDLISAVALNDDKQRAFELFGANVVKKSYTCDADAGELRVYGLIGDPSVASGGSKGVYWFVNRRPIKDKILNHAVNEAYRSLLPRGVSPFSVLFININPDLVDVNVHPTKSRVRFLKGNAVHDFVMNAVKGALNSRSGESVVSFCSNDVEACVSLRGEGQSNPVPSFEVAGSPRRSGDLLAMTNRHGFISKGRFSSLRVIGQLHNSFLLCEKDGGMLVVIDQHAAHERIGYEKLKSDFRNQEVQSQRLLVPEVVTVAPQATGYLEEATSELGKIGWEIEHFGGDEFCVKAVPAILGNINLKAAVTAMAEDMQEFGKFDSHEDKIEYLLKVSACHAQVRAGDRLTNTEIEHLLREMDKYDWAGRCPHGRPAVAEVTLHEIEKWFNRT